MPPITDINSWDAIESTTGDVVITLHPLPRPKGVAVVGDEVFVVTCSRSYRLAGSARLCEVVLRATTLVVAEAHEHIVRETLVPVALITQEHQGEREDDLQAA